jgi:hypothetical protein
MFSYNIPSHAVIYYTIKLNQYVNFTYFIKILSIQVFLAGDAILMIFLPTEARTYVVFGDYFKTFFWSTDFKYSWFKHKLKLFVFKCTIHCIVFFDVRNLVLCLTNTETCKKYSVTVIFDYIFHIKPQFFKPLFQSQFFFDFDDIFTQAYHQYAAASDKV